MFTSKSRVVLHRLQRACPHPNSPAQSTGQQLFSGRWISSFGRPDRTGYGFPADGRRIRSRDKDPFGYTFGRRYPKPRPLDGPNLIYEERIRSQTAMAQPVTMPQQNFDYFLVLDFEATCDAAKKSIVPQEIIEFPVVKLDATTMKPLATFHQYVQPVAHPQLTPFCTRLTGIIQDMIDGQPSIEAVLKQFDDWMAREVFTKPDVRFSFVTCGDWDLKEMLPQQARHFKLPLPAYFDNWINIKHAFSETVGHYPRGLKLMLNSLGVEHTGRAHSGIDDCKNIVNIMRALAERGHIFHTPGPLNTPKMGTISKAL